MTRKKKETASPVQIPAVIYARYSSAGQRDESIEGQIRECTEYAERNGFRIINTYADKALTGRTDKRPAFQQMIADSDKQIFKAVICWKTDRFARNRYDAATYKYKLRKNGVRLYYAREAVPEGPEGIILESVMEGFAEYYSANLGENVKRGNYDSALQFKTLGKKVFGYRRSAEDTYEIDPETAPIVRRIFAEYDAGRRSKDIVADLNRDGYCTTKGNPFNTTTLCRMLKNEKYIGIYEFKDIRAEGTIPALIDRAQFDRVQKRLARYKHSPRVHEDVRFLLTGKLFCGHCGSAMTGDSAISHTGARHYYYTCTKRKKRQCDKKRTKKDLVENFVVGKLVEIVMDDSFCEFLANKCVEMMNKSMNDKSRENSIIARLKECDKRISNIINAIAEGISSESLKQALAQLEAERNELSSELAIEQSRKPAIDRDMILLAIDRLRTGDINDRVFRERLVETFLNSVYLYDDGRCVIHLNFSDADTVTLQLNDSIVKSSNREVSGTPDAMKTNPICTDPGIVSMIYVFA